MSSLVSGNSILHIANRLGDERKDPTSCEGEMELSSTPPNSASDHNSETDSPFRFKIFKDLTKNTYSTVPTTPSSSSNEETRQVTPAEMVQNEETPSAAPFDLMKAVSQLQKDIQGNQGLPTFFNGPSTDSNNQNQAPDGGLTMRDLMPGYSPWLRNAGRKKSHPVWDFFKDLKDTNGVGGVICLNCSWSGDDRSPNNLRTHLKKFHTADGIFAKFSQKLSQVGVCLPGFRPNPMCSFVHGL